MGFKSFFIKREESRKAQPEPLMEIFSHIDTSDWNQVLSACIGRSMIIQENGRGCVVKGRGWHLDFKDGAVFFGESQYPARFLGTESKKSSSFMWAWNNINQLEDHMLTTANEAKAYGEKWNLKELCTPQLELSPTVNGQTLAMVACTLSSEACFFYRAPHYDGAIFVSVEDLPKEIYQRISIGRFASLTAECFELYPVDHKIFIESTLQWNKTPYTWVDDTHLTARFPQELFVTFEKNDSGYRLASMTTK